MEARTADGRLVCRTCRVAATPWLRLRGLLGRTLEVGDGLHIRPCRSVHMFFMRYAVDVVFLDADGRVVRVVADLRPWRTASCRGARSVLELPAGACARAGLREADTVQFSAPAGHP